MPKQPGRPQFVPPMQVEIIKRLLQEDGEPNMSKIGRELQREGHTNASSTGRRWAAAVHAEAYVTATPNNHIYTQPRAEDVETVQVKTAENQRKVAQVLAGYRASGEDVYMVGAADAHCPGVNQDAVELAWRCAEAWFAGQENTLYIDMGDVWHLSTQSTYTPDMPFVYKRPHKKLLSVDELLYTLESYRRYEAGWASVVKDRIKITGNHDIRFLRYMMRVASSVSEFGAIQLMDLMEEVGVHFLGWGVDRVLLRDDFLVLHGEYARKWPGASAKGTMEMNLWTENVVQGHVHRVNSNAYTRSDGRVVFGWEVGTLGELQPEYRNTHHNWQPGVFFARYNPNNQEPIEAHNIPFLVRKYGGIKYLTADFLGQEFRVKHTPSSGYDKMVARGDFLGMLDNDLI